MVQWGAYQWSWKHYIVHTGVTDNITHLLSRRARASLTALSCTDHLGLKKMFMMETPEKGSTEQAQLIYFQQFIFLFHLKETKMSRIPFKGGNWINFWNKCSGCGSVGRAVASNTRDLRFESRHLQNFIYQLYILKEKTKKDNEAGNGPS